MSRIRHDVYDAGEALQPKKIFLPIMPLAIMQILFFILSIRYLQPNLNMRLEISSSTADYASGSVFMHMDPFAIVNSSGFDGEMISRIFVKKHDQKNNDSAAL